MYFQNPIIEPDLIERVVRGKKNIPHSVHGLAHWRRVERNGLFLASREGADCDVVSFFALFHDSRRINDFEDPEHGLRGAILAKQLYDEGLLPLNLRQMDTLFYACEHHTDMRHTEDLTSSCCWDADRLDLTRLGIVPELEFLNTTTAKDVAELMDYTEIEAYVFKTSETNNSCHTTSYKAL